MDLAKQAQIVDSIHDTLHDFVGQRLKVRANMGRSKIVESEGTLMQVHPQLFIMEVESQAWPHRPSVVPVRRRAYRHGRAVAERRAAVRALRSRGRRAGRGVSSHGGARPVVSGFNRELFADAREEVFDKQRLNEENTFSRKAQNPWGCSSAGRALRSQRRGRGFESHHLHHGNAKAVGPTGGLFSFPKARKLGHFGDVALSVRLDGNRRERF